MNSRVIDVGGLVDAAPKMDGRGVELVMCDSCGEYWPEDSQYVPSERDDNPTSMCLCHDCHIEVLES